MKQPDLSRYFIYTAMRRWQITFSEAVKNIRWSVVIDERKITFPFEQNVIKIPPLEQVEKFNEICRVERSARKAIIEFQAEQARYKNDIGKMAQAWQAYQETILRQILENDKITIDDIVLDCENDEVAEKGEILISIHGKLIYKMIRTMVDEGENTYRYDFSTQIIEDEEVPEQTDNP